MPTAGTTVDAAEVFVTRGRPVLRFAVVAAVLVGVAQLLVRMSVLVPSLELGDGSRAVLPSPGGATTVVFALHNAGATPVELGAITAGPGTEVQRATVDSEPLVGSRLPGGATGDVELLVHVDCAVAAGIEVRVEAETVVGLRRTTELVAVYDDTRPRTGRAWTGPTITVADGTSTAYCLP